MAKSKSILKRARQNEVRRVRNAGIKSSVKTAVKKAEQAIEQKDYQTAPIKLAEAISTIDKASAKGVIPKKRASRKISRLSRRGFKELASGPTETNQ